MFARPHGKRLSHPLGTLAALAAIATLVCSHPTHAVEAPPPSSATAARPPAPPSTRAPGCTAAPLPLADKHLPFGSGEQLSYELAVLGVRTGTIRIDVGERQTLDGATVVPLQARALNDGIFNALSAFDSHMTSFLDLESVLPVSMVNRMSSRRLFQDKTTVSHENGSFRARPGRVTTARVVDVHARLRRSGPDGTTDQEARLKSSSDVVDLLSLLYYVRGRPLTAGTPICLDLFHRRRLWRVDGTVGGVEVVRVPAGERKARRWDLRIERTARGAPPRPLTVWVSEDADRLPLLVATPEGLGKLEVKLAGHASGAAPIERPRALPLMPP